MDSRIGFCLSRIFLDQFLANDRGSHSFPTNLLATQSKPAILEAISSSMSAIWPTRLAAEGCTAAVGKGAAVGAEVELGCGAGEAAGFGAGVGVGAGSVVGVGATVGLGKRVAPRSGVGASVLFGVAVGAGLGAVDWVWLDRAVAAGSDGGAEVGATEGTGPGVNDLKCSETRTWTVASIAASTALVPWTAVSMVASTSRAGSGSPSPQATEHSSTRYSATAEMTLIPPTTYCR